MVQRARFDSRGTTALSIDCRSGRGGGVVFAPSLNVGKPIPQYRQYEFDCGIDVNLKRFDVRQAASQAATDGP